MKITLTVVYWTKYDNLIIYLWRRIHCEQDVLTSDVRFIVHKEILFKYCLQRLPVSVICNNYWNCNKCKICNNYSKLYKIWRLL